MAGKRIVIMKRPAVVWTVAFVVGIIMGQTSRLLVYGSVAILLLGYMVFLQRLRKGRRRISAADKLLVCVPVFLLLGYGVMCRERHLYERDVSVISSCLESGREVLAEGTVSHIRRTETGVCLELSDAVMASYTAGENAYRPAGTLLVYTEDLFAENGEIKYGQRLFVYGKGSLFEEAPNPGGFDAKQYYFSLGITGTIHGKAVRIRSFSVHRLNQALFQAKNKLLESYITYLGERGAGVLSSMLLGERALLSEETQELYRHGGISHILAISGLHVSLIGTALYEWLRKTVLGRNGAIPVACAGVLLYGSFVEAGTSTKRAVIMFLLLLMATALGRTYDTLSAMSVSVIVILWGSPGALYTASFQLSFAAAYGASVLAMVLGKRRVTVGKDTIEKAKEVARRKRSRLFRVGEYIKENIRNMFVFGLAVQAVTFPFTVYHFYEYPTYGFLLNPMVVPLMTILLLCCLLSGVSGLFVPWLGYFFAGGARGILWIYEILCRGAEQLPGSVWLIGRPTGWQMILYYVLLAGCLYVWMGTGRIKVGRGDTCGNGFAGRVRQVFRKLTSEVSKCLECQHVVFIGLLCLPFVLLPVPGARFEAAFLDVGQGDGIVLRERGGAVLLVDGGSTSVQKVGKKRMIPCLKAKGIRVIDCAFISHTDSDHISGVKEILTAMPMYSEYRESMPGYTGTPVITRLVLPEWNSLLREQDEGYSELVRLAEEKQVEVCYMEAGDRMTVGTELVLSCLAPEEEDTYDNKNAASMVLLASYGAFDLLLTGDMEKEGELRLLETGDLSSDPVEVLKVSHHGSHTASSQDFIAALAPRISIISCGKNNRYGHPHTETLETLYGANSRVYRTDESGCVTVKVGKRIKVEEFSKRK